MMEFPSEFEKRIQGQLLKEADLFFNALRSESPVSIRIHPYKNTQAENLEPIPWNPFGFYLPDRPSFTLDPAFHAGTYYVQEASSMSLQFVLDQIPLEGALALDLCAAPGGKSSLIATHLYEKEGMLLANEVIRSRAQILKENLIKWGLPNIAVSNLDARNIAASGLQFDLIAVDAPCSGEGMFRKDEAARQEWSEQHVDLCAARQQRILADILPALKPGGYLIYSTCTFSEEENENNLHWLAQELELESLEIPFPPDWQIRLKEKNGVKGYAFYPHLCKGEGFFIALLRKKEETNTRTPKDLKKPGKEVNSPELNKWLTGAPYCFEWFDGLYAVPQSLVGHASALFRLPLQYLGVKAAEPAGHDLKPSSELAFSLIHNREAFSSVELTRRQALHFLRRDELKFPDAEKGWLRMDYQGNGLGFVKNLGNRCNSQYPKEWRIRMALPDELPLPVLP